MTSENTNIILGGTGHVGKAVAETLLQNNQKVLLITRSEKNKSEWEKKGAKVEIANINDTDTLTEIFKQGSNLFLLNPPGDISKNSIEEEKSSLKSILKAISESSIKKIVAQSTQGAQKGEAIGDLGILYDMEQELRKTAIPSVFVRAAYYLSNWDMSLDTAKNENKIISFFPADFILPMVAPQDIGKFNAKCLIDEIRETKVVDFSGPEDYSIQDVADAFSEALKKKIELEIVPKEKWVETYKNQGFSQVSAESYANMTATTLDGKYKKSENKVRGETSLQFYINHLIEKNT